jgi:hypothetical protein
MRTVTVKNRSWSEKEAGSEKADRRESADPVTAALVNYSYARV